MAYDRTNAGRAALGFARELTGKPYVYGGTWPGSGGTDCSGLWEWAYQQVGITLPRTTYDQYKVAQIPPAWPSEPGDLLFIAGSDAVGALPGHVMGYVSPGQVFQAPFTGEPITQYPYDTNVYEYRTRPALLAPLPPPNPSPVPDSPAALLGPHRRPSGPLPLLVPGKPSDPDWNVYACELGRLVGLWPKLRRIRPSGYGTLLQGLCVRSKAHYGVPMDGTFGDREWGARLWNAYGVR